jgi:hypothetical protein
MASDDLRRKFKDTCVAFGLLKQNSADPMQIGDLERLVLYLKELPAHERERALQEFTAILSPLLPSPVTEATDATMTWEDMREFAQRGGQIGSHTTHHQILTTVPSSEVQSELADAKREIEERLGRKCNLFAYPNGSWSQEVREIVIREGHSLAFVNHVGLWTPETDPWLIPRVNLWEDALLGPSGRFSFIVFQYVVFWRSYLAEVKRRRQNPTERFGNPRAK